MKFSNDTLLISIDSLLDEKMRIVNGEKVLIDFELAEILQVSTKALIRTIRANPQRFPDDFLIKIQAKHFIHSIPLSERRRRILYSFTLGGIMMAAGRFHTERANQISIQMVEFICGRSGGIEEILKMIKKSGADKI